MHKQLSLETELNASFTDEESPAELVETKKSLSRRAIDQIGYIKDVNSLAVLAGMCHF